MVNQERIQELSLEDVMGDRFGRYSKYIIQERALPDIRDGLKPVQRRILYAMYQDGNTPEKAFRKSAKAVGTIMGNFHPHGDISIYEALVRMSQSWKLRAPLIEMHGNNGSMDGDPPAAMRYTEARLSEVSMLLLQDIEQETVPFMWNFDDTAQEPEVLPAGFPNLLINGATGISAGYATEIPPHNLSEVIQAVIYYLDHPEASLEALMKYIPGPDFPTGGIIQGKQGLIDAYTTGKGKIVLRAKTEVVSGKQGRSQIVITEIPYEVNKAQLVKKIDELRLTKKLDGLHDVRDESDRNGLQIVIELKKDIAAEAVLMYLYKHTDLQITYHFNMVAISDHHPKQVGLKAILDAYIKHRLTVLKARTQFELTKAQKRVHILSGIIMAITHLDDVIDTIRHSKNKAHAKQALRQQLELTEEQAEAIVTLPLYRLTSTDMDAVTKEYEALLQQIEDLEALLASDVLLRQLMKKELKKIVKQYGEDRLTQIESDIEALEVAPELLVSEEDVYVVCTQQGYMKRCSLRSVAASKGESTGRKEDDPLVFLEKLSTLTGLLWITNKGTVCYRSVFELPEYRFKDIGEHMSHMIRGISSDEYIVQVIPVTSFDTADTLIWVTQGGFVKKTLLSDLTPWRSYKKRGVKGIQFKEDTDQVIQVLRIKEELADQIECIFYTQSGMMLRCLSSEFPVVGLKASGVKGIELNDQDDVVAFQTYQSTTSPYHFIFNQQGKWIYFDPSKIPLTHRAVKGTSLKIMDDLRFVLLAQDEPCWFVSLMDGTAVTFELESSLLDQIKIGDLQSLFEKDQNIQWITSICPFIREEK